MRDLRGDTTDRAVDVEPHLLEGGRAPNEHSFLASLGRTIAAAAAADQRVLAFRARSYAVGLRKWSETVAPPVDELDAAIDERILDTDPSIVILRLGGDVLGFASEPRDDAEAEQLGGALAARLSTAIGEPGPRFALASRLGVAIVEGPPPGAARLAAAVAGAIEAVDRTIAQTSAETPYLVHNDYIRQRSLRQEEIGAELERAMAERQITLEFQPRVAVVDLAHTGLEVFPRWVHPELGPIHTVDLLRAAEHEGHLGPLGQQVRNDAMDMARRWAADGTLGDRRLWFDVAPIEMLDRRFLDEAALLVETWPEIPIGFEMTDSPLLEAPVFDPVFHAIEELDVALALDNVRPSTLSFGRIQKLPIGYVNLDHEMVRAVTSDPGQCDLVRVICGYANDRGLLVTACQVETSEELSRLAELGVDQVQGYAVSEPLAEADLWPALDRPVPDPSSDTGRNGAGLTRGA